MFSLSAEMGIWMPAIAKGVIESTCRLEWRRPPSLRLGRALVAALGKHVAAPANDACTPARARLRYVVGAAAARIDRSRIRSASSKTASGIVSGIRNRITLKWTPQV